MSRLPTRSLLAVTLALAAGEALAQQHHHAAMHMQDVTPQDDASTASVEADQASSSSAHSHHAGMPMPMPMPHDDQPQSAQTPPPMPAEHAMHEGMDMHDMHAVPTALPRPTPEELAAAFPDVGDAHMATHMDDDPTVGVFRGDRLERMDGGTAAWDARFGIGGSFDRIWLRTEGERPRGGPGEGDVELQWTHATGPWWDRAVSLRHDFGPGPSRQWLGVGVIGLAPYKFELEAHVYVGSHGLAARTEAEYEVLLTNRLVLTPRVELNAFSRDDRANGIGKGLSNGEAGLRLRYEFTREFAPYVGYSWTRKVGNTADLARETGEPVLDHGWVAGVRLWF